MAQRVVVRIGQALVHAFHIAAASVKQPLEILLTMRQLPMQTGAEQVA